MKKRNTILVFLLAGLLLIVGCCKDEKCRKDARDYRANYIGDWDFVVDRTWRINMDSGRDTFYYLGKISLGNTDSTLNIEYLEYNTLIQKEIYTDLVVDKFGDLDNQSTYRPFICGKFEGNDKVHLEENFWNPANMGYTSITDGTKKKGGKYE